MSDDSQMTPAEGSDVVAETSYQPGDVEPTPSPVATQLQPPDNSDVEPTPSPVATQLQPPAAYQPGDAEPTPSPVATKLQPPPAAGQPSVWKNLVMGAISGLAGSAGATHFGGGLAGGAANTLNQSIAAKQRAFENNQEQQKTQSDIKFQSVHAADLAIDTAKKEKEVNSWDQDHQDEHTKSQLDIATKLQNLGFTPIASTDDNNDAALATGRNLTKTNGAVGPTYTLDLGKSHLTFALDQIAGSPQGLDIVNRQRTGLGQTALTAAQFQQLKPSDRITATKQALDFAHPTIANQKQMDDAQAKLATMQAQPNPSDDLKADIASLQQSIDLGTKVIANSNQAKNDQTKANAAAKKAGTVSATPPKPAAADAGEWKPKVTADEKKKAELAENIAENANAVNAILARRPNITGGSLPTTVEQMIGNNDPDISALGTRIHNIAMANSGVHGFRSQEGVKDTEANFINHFRNGPDAVRGALKASTDSVQTFIDNARPEGYQTHSNQGGAYGYYQKAATVTKGDAAKVHGNFNDFKQATPTKEHGMLYTDDGQNWYTSDGSVYKP